MYNQLFAKINKLKQDKELGAIVYIGSGTSEIHDDLQTLKPESIIYVEAQAEQCKALRQKVGNATNVTVHEYGIVADGSNQKDFYLTDPSCYSSFLKPAQLLDCMPNLAVNISQGIETKYFTDFIKGLALNKEKLNILLLEVNGYEQPLLQSVTGDVLLNFDLIAIEQDENSFYQNASDLPNNAEIKKTAASLKDSCFTLVETQEGSFFNQVSYLQDDKLVQIKKLAARNSELEASNSKLTADSSQLKARNTELEANSSQLAARSQQLEANNTKLIADSSQLTARNSEIEANSSQLAARSQQLEASNTKLTADSSQLKARNAEIEANSSKLAARSQQLEASNTKLTADSLQLKARNSEIEARNSQLQSKQNELVDSHRSKDAQIDDLTQQRDREANWHQKNKKRAEDLQKQLENEINKSNSITSKKSVIESIISELETQISTLESEKDELLAGNSSLTAKLEALNAESLNIKQNLGESEAQVSSKDAQVTAYRQQIESYANSVNKLNEKIDDRVKHADLGQKMLAKAHIDLEQLRLSYKQKTESEQALIELVRDLRQKLSLASEYYHRLQNQHPELVLDLTEMAGSN